MIIPMLALLAALSAVPSPASAAVAADSVTRVDMSVGRSHPITTVRPITRVSVAAPDVADVIVVSQHELVVNAKASGETDAIVWQEGGAQTHYRIVVHSPGDRMQIVLYVKFAEVRRDLLQQLGVSLRYQDQHTRVGTGSVVTDQNLVPAGSPGSAVGSLASSANFLTIISDLGTDRLLAILEAEEQRGNARTLAEPNVMAANKEWGTFLSGGELPIPVVQSTGGAADTRAVTIVYRQFGVRLRFMGEIVSDSLLKLSDTLEVSDLDYTNAIELSGFSIPALRTRRVESTLDVRPNQSLVISGLFDNRDQVVKTGIPFLKDIPLLGALFKSSSVQRSQTELIVIVTPVIVDPMHPRMIDVVPTPPDTVQPARGVLQRPPLLTAPKSPRRP